MFLPLYALVGCASPEASDSAGTPTHEGGAPLVTLTPTELSFGDVPVGVPSTLELRIANEGGGELSATLALSDDAAGFSVDTFDLELEADLGQRVNVTFEPLAVGEVAISLVVTSNDEVEPVKFVPITGSGLGPQLELVEDPVVLGDVGLRCPVKGQMLVHNVGMTPVVIGSFAFADPMFSTSSPGVTLAPDERTSINVTATPLMLGESVGTLVAETALGSVVAGMVSVTGVAREEVHDVYTVPTDDSDILVVLDGTLPDGIEGIRGQLEALLLLAEGDHRLAVSVADDGCVPGGWIDNATVDPGSALDQMLATEVGDLADQGFVRGLAALSPEATGPAAAARPRRLPAGTRPRSPPTVCTCRSVTQAGAKTSWTRWRLGLGPARPLS